MTQRENRPNAHVNRPDEGDMEQAIHALHGIFYTLNLLITHRVDHLIKAGQIITEEISERF